MKDTTHLVALMTNLSHAKVRASMAKPAQRELQNVFVAQLEKEVASERAFLGIGPDTVLLMTDDELLAELQA